MPSKQRTTIKKKSVGKKKVKLPSISNVKNKVWEECKRITRARYKKGEVWECFTCGRILDEPVKCHTGHCIPSASCGAYLRYDLRNLRVQCYFCNINLGGNGAQYYKRLVETEGQEYVDKLFRDKFVTVKADIYWYLQKLEELKVIHT